MAMENTTASRALPGVVSLPLTQPNWSLNQLKKDWQMVGKVYVKLLTNCLNKKAWQPHARRNDELSEMW